jgi:AbrB family looped-hinge helix DNA binding protein
MVVCTLILAQEDDGVSVSGREPGNPEVGYDGDRTCGDADMELVKLGKKGQVTIPKGILRRLGIPDEAPLVVEATEDGAIVLRQAVVYPIEIYTDARVEEFSEASRITPQEEARVEAALRKRKPKKK